MPTAFELGFIDGPPLSRRRWRLAPGFRIGRGAACELDLPDPSVSRLHATFDVDAEGWSLRDCGSLIGTRLNELPLVAQTEAALHPGDVVAIGPWRFRVETAEVPDALETAAAAGARIDVVGQLGNLAEQRLALLLRCAGEVAAAEDEQALADALAEHALLGSGYARAAVLWRTGEDIVLRSLRPISERASAGFRFQRALIASAEAGELARFDVGDSEAAKAEPAAQRALCAPLMLDGHAEAFLYVDATRPDRRGHSDAPTFVQALARLAALALANLRRLDSERARAALSADLERAREVQQRLLPDARQPTHGVCHALHLHPGRTVAGDIADVIALDGGQVAVLLGDVSGAGLGASLVMASVQSFLRAELAHDTDPGQAIARLNRHLCAQASSGRFVTLWLGVLDPHSRRCRFVDAGHGHAVHLHDGEAEPIDIRGDIPLGIDAGAGFHVEERDLAANDGLLLYSDGAIEQRDDSDEPFGRERLIAAVRGANGPDAIVAAALAALQQHAAGRLPDDDTTVLAIGWSA